MADREYRLGNTSAPDPQDHEAYAEYAAQLLGVVESITNWSDPNQVCILAHAPYNDDSQFAAELANAGKVIMPCLMQMATNQNVGDRLRSVAVMIQIRAKGNVDVATRSEIRSIAVRALHGSDEDVRASSVDMLGAFGGQDVIPELQRLAETDPAPAVQGVSIRTTARDAIAAIRKRTNQSNSK